jgi:hypothetical protein
MFMMLGKEQGQTSNAGKNIRRWKGTARWYEELSSSYVRIRLFEVAFETKCEQQLNKPTLA